MSTKFKAALKMSNMSPDDKVTTGTNIVNSITAAPAYFPASSLPIPLASLTACVNNLHTAILGTASGTAGSISNMHEKERILLSMFGVLRAWVEMQANNTADPKTVIEAAGMTAVQGNGGSSVTELTITALGNGEMQVSVPRSTGEAAFIYEYSGDGGTTWAEFTCSKLATVSLKGQTPASTLLFRYTPIGKTRGATSQSKSAIVL